MSCPKHNFHVSRFGYIMINNIQIDSTKACKLLEDGRIQMKNMEKENAEFRKLLKFTADALVKDAEDGSTIWYSEGATLWEQITSKLEEKLK